MIARCVSFIVVLCAASTLLSCTRDTTSRVEESYRPAKDEFSIMTYNLLHFSFSDRNKDGQADNFKPQEEIDAAMAIISRVRPDVLAVQEMGDENSLQQLRDLLKAKGLSYDHTDFLYSSTSNANMALLSRFPIIVSRPIQDAHYSIADEDVPVTRGFISVDIKVNDDYLFRMMVAHLKSKLYHPLGQTEMRRNEARLLNKYARHALEEMPDLNLIVVGDLNDSITSAALREALGKDPNILYDLQPRDYLGDIWSHFWADEELYERIDYMLVSTGMLRDVVSDKTHAVRDPLTYKASDHRPLVAVFKARDL